VFLQEMQQECVMTSLYLVLTACPVCGALTPHGWTHQCGDAVATCVTGALTTPYVLPLPQEETSCIR